MIGKASADATLDATIFAFAPCRLIAAQDAATMTTETMTTPGALEKIAE